MKLINNFDFFFRFFPRFFFSINSMCVAGRNAAINRCELKNWNCSQAFSLLKVATSTWHSHGSYVCCRWFHTLVSSVNWLNQHQVTIRMHHATSMGSQQRSLLSEVCQLPSTTSSTRSTPWFTRTISNSFSLASSMPWSFRFGASCARPMCQSHHGIHSQNRVAWSAICSLAVRSIHTGGTALTSSWFTVVLHSSPHWSSIWSSSRETLNSSQHQPPLKHLWPILKSLLNSFKASNSNQSLLPFRFSSFCMSSTHLPLNIIWPAHSNCKMKVSVHFCCSNTLLTQFGHHSLPNLQLNIRSPAFQTGYWLWSASFSSAVWFSNDLLTNWSIIIVSTQAALAHRVSIS